MSLTQEIGLVLSMISVPKKVAHFFYLNHSEKGICIKRKSFFFFPPRHSPKSFIFWLKSGIKIYLQTPATLDSPAFFRKSNFLPCHLYLFQLEHSITSIFSFQTATRLHSLSYTPNSIPVNTFSLYPQVLLVHLNRVNPVSLICSISSTSTL